MHVVAAATATVLASSMPAAESVVAAIARYGPPTGLAAAVCILAGFVATAETRSVR